MIETLVIWAWLVERELLLFCGIWFLIGGIDDLAMDGAWLIRRVWRKVAVQSRFAPWRAGDLPDPDPALRMALLIPAWQEAGVIGPMLAETGRRWPMPGLSIHVGCYPDDTATIAEVMAAARHDPRIRLALTATEGPTTKADCLNALWRALALEERHAPPPRTVILHDAEDLVHQDALRIFAHLGRRADLIQIPVEPLAVPGTRWISSHYCDEFAESHGKQMVMREALGAAVPSAGVGCAISYAMLRAIAAGRGGQPFDATSLTEDYELGLTVARLGGRGIHVRIRDDEGRLVATRAHFPHRFHDSVRQKSRWLAGIALAGWDRLGWGSRPAETRMRLRDRRAPFAALLLAAAYLAVLVGGLLALAMLAGQRVPPMPPMVVLLVKVNGAMLLYRAAVRACFVARAYGPGQALLSIPRAMIANLIAIFAARRAMTLYARHLLGATLRWEKTQHSFPVSAGAQRTT